MFFGSPPPPPVRAAALPPIESAYIFAAIAAALVALYAAQTRRPDGQPGQFLPPPKTEKREYEVWVLKYSVVWMGTFAVVIAFQLYEAFDAAAYFLLCGGLALPLLMQPLFMRTASGRAMPSIGAQHAARAQLWIVIFGFIGNYWCACQAPCDASRPRRPCLHLLARTIIIFRCSLAVVSSC